MIDALKNMKIPERPLFSSDNRVDIITDFMKVEFPIFMQFPPKNIGQPIPLPDSTKHPRPSKETIEAINYYNELCEKSQAELLVLRDNARTKKDAVYFDSIADFQHWGKRGVWSIEQGVALLLEMNPEIVNLGVMKERLYSPKAIKFKQYMELANSDLKISDITGMKTENLPPYFLKWAAAHDIKIPPELQNVVDKYQDKWISWKEMYEQVKARVDSSPNVELAVTSLAKGEKDTNSILNKNPVLAWILAVTMHKFYKGEFTNTEGKAAYTLAKKIIDYAEKEGIKNKKTDVQISKWVEQARESIEICVSEIIEHNNVTKNLVGEKHH